LPTVIISRIHSIASEIVQLCAVVLRLLVPVIIVVRALELLGVVDWIAAVMQPAMNMLGLPASMSIVLATGMITSIYPALAVFFTLAPAETLTVAQVTVLGSVMLLAHGLLLEGRVAQQAGVNMLFTVSVRLFGGLLLGWLLHQLYEQTQWLQQTSHSRLLVIPVSDTHLDWLLAQLRGLMMIMLVIAALVCLLRLLRWLGIERLMILLLRRPLALVGIGPTATPLTIVGITLGLTFGAGILIREARAGKIPPRDIWAAMTLLGVCHSIIEDTITIMLLGAHIGGVLWARVVFAFVYSAVLYWLLRSHSHLFYNRHMIRNDIAPAGS
jgi:hypothetical protein